MKLTAFLLLIALSQISAKSYSQTVSISGQDISLAKIFRNIQKQTGYNFICTKEQISQAKDISLHVHNAPLQEVLDYAFKGQPLTYSIVNKTIIVKYNNPSPVEQKTIIAPIHITGTITDSATGNPLVGVTIKVKGNTLGTVTNDQGQFSLEVPNDAILEISYVGYNKKEISVQDKTVLHINLGTSASGLNQLVVVGYGNKQTKLSITGSISTIYTEELKQSPVANLTNALAGRLPGLTTIQTSGLPGSDASDLYIRGVSTYGGDKSPLVVIDGLPRPGVNFGELDANNIASISILKDASSTSLYGIQGANGVILITTKRGRNGKPEIQLNAQTSIQTPSRLPKYLDPYRSALLDNEGEENDGQPLLWTQTQLQAMKDKTDPYTYPDVNWFKEILNPSAPQQQFNLNITGGNESITYFVSGSYLHQSSLLKNSNDNKYGVKYKYDRFNFRSNVDIKVNERLNLRLDLATRLGQRTGPGSGYPFIFTMLNDYTYGTAPVKNPNGSWAAGLTMPGDWRNILAEVEATGYYQNFDNVTNGTVEANQKLDFITDGLEVKGLFTFENNGGSNFSETQSYDSYRYKKDPDGTETYIPFTTATSLTKGYNTSSNRFYFYDVQLSYNKDFGIHSLSGMLLGNRSYQTVANDLPHVYQGLVGKLAYNFAQKYFFEFNIGYNGSENFAPGRRYGAFPAISGAWIISKENFFNKKIAFLDFLKVRASYGIVGNDQIGGSRWLFLSSYTEGNGFIFGNPGAGVNGYYANSVGNEDVTWERAHKLDIGLNAQALNGGIDLSLDYFHELRSDILTNPQTIPDYLGITGLQPGNVGSVVNRGLEMDLKINSRLGRNTSFFVNLNYSLAKDKILDADEPHLPYAYQYMKGQPVGYALGYVADGLFRTQADIDKGIKPSFSSSIIPGDIRYKDLNGDGIIDEMDRKMMPQWNFPTQTFGFSFGVKFKRIDFSALLQGALGGKADYQSYLTYGNQFRPFQWKNRWTPKNAESATFPIIHKTNLSNTNTFSTFWIYSSNYLKLRNVEIGFNFPEQWIKKLKMAKLRFYLRGENLATWDKLPIKDLDPEVDPSQVSVPYPLMKIFDAGVTVNFE